MEKRTLQKLGLVCVSVILCSAASWWSGNSNEEAEKQVRKLAEQPVAEQVQEIKITVCVSGAVAKPGLYEVTKGSRAQQVIELAGGVTEEADMDRVNLAQLCKDGGHIKVPRLSKARMKKKMEDKAMAKDSNQARDAKNVTGSNQDYSPDRNISGEMLISLNSASETELTQLPGVGAATARRIISFRKRQGFQRVEELMKVPGIGPAKFAKMKPYLAL